MQRRRSVSAPPDARPFAARGRPRDAHGVTAPPGPGRCWLGAVIFGVAGFAGIGQAARACLRVRNRRYPRVHSSGLAPLCWQRPPHDGSPQYPARVPRALNL